MTQQGSRGLEEIPVTKNAEQRTVQIYQQTAFIAVFHFIPISKIYYEQDSTFLD